MSHGDTVMTHHQDSNHWRIQAIALSCHRHKSKPIYGLQWHPEVIHTKHGTMILHNYFPRAKLS